MSFQHLFNVATQTIGKVVGQSCTVSSADSTASHTGVNIIIDHFVAVSNNDDSVTFNNILITIPKLSVTRFVLQKGCKVIESTGQQYTLRHKHESESTQQSVWVANRGE